MDPFTQRMLERAKMRREKLDSHKLELEQGTSLETTNNLNMKRKPFSEKIISENENIDVDKKPKEYITDMRKSKLQRLARFYSGNDENILIKDDDYQQEDNITENFEKKQQLKLGRLKELATKIKEWDDDVKVAPFVKKIENAKDENKTIGQTVTEKENPTSWDTDMVEKLCSQGFSLSNSEFKLTYQFDKTKGESKKIEIGGKKVNELCKHFREKETNSTDEDTKIKYKSDMRSGPESEVLKKAALFEFNAKEESSKQIKDPAELSLAERKALFENNIRHAVFPKNRFNHHEKKIFLKELNDENSKSLRENKIEKVEAMQKPVEEIKSEKPLEKNLDNAGCSYKSNCSTAVKTSLDQKNEELKEVIPTPPPMPMFVGRDDEQKNCKSPMNSSNTSFKSGRLYPSLSNLDITQESEPSCSEIESVNVSRNSNVYLNMTLSDLLEVNKNNPSTPPSEKSFSKSKECQVLNKMDRLLEDALNDVFSESEGEKEDELRPSPPKMMKSSSFEYKSHIDDSKSLLHTVSFYRKQQQNSALPPNEIVEEEKESKAEVCKNEEVLVQRKIEDLLTEVNKQQSIISQASQALNLCLSTVEFSGSGEQAEGERLLLLATHKRQACLNEIQRLKVENSLRPQGENNLLTERGDVILTSISVKLKRDALRAIAAAETLLYFVCLIKSDEQVLATPVASASRENLKELALQFPGQVKLESLLSNFKITIEVYNLELNKEMLPHDVKYHIINKKEKKLLTPIKNKKSESKLVKPQIQSPAGPNAVRTSNFQMCGYIVFSLREVSRTQWSLNKVPYISPLEGTISMTIKSQLRLDDEFRGFLTMFDDISGFGAWHRRWCLLSSHFISFWKYPDDEQRKVPIGTIDLRLVITENVGLVSRDVCARLNTFLLESTRPRLSEDKNSLVLSVSENVTTIRHLLSADSKQEMMVWCKKLNTTLALLRSWKCNFNE